MQNHVIDPTYFYDAIEEFSFNFKLYVLTGKTRDLDTGKTKSTYTTEIVRGSLQSQGQRLNQTNDGNTVTVQYNFYCKSFYRISIGDILEYKNLYLRVDSVQDYDEYGCRQCSMSMIQLTAYRDLADYIKYQQGEVLV